MRYQVRMNMAALIGLGRGERGLSGFRASPGPGHATFTTYVRGFRALTP